VPAGRLAGMTVWNGLLPLRHMTSAEMDADNPFLSRGRHDPLPIDSVLPDLTATLRRCAAAVLVAPPGAGKTTRVPLVLAGEPWAQGRKILVLEPRRVAARAAAARMAATLGESVGGSVGYRVRFGSKVSDQTRIEVVTGGIFTRHVLEHPGLDDVAAVLFDEFHERSLDADLGLALTRDLQKGWREDLKLLVMSATLDASRVAKILGDAPVIESAGKSFPVETRYLGRDLGSAIEQQIAQAALRALRAERGSLLVFIPGAAEIRRTEALLRERVSDPLIDVVALHGALPAEIQDRAIAPAVTGHRKVVLATSIAETSLTIEGVRVVIDSGLARVPRYEPDVGLTRLETVRVSRASADQRRGRAGRTEAGVCLRLWDEQQTASLEPASRPEILSSDLSGFVLDLAHWGVSDPSALIFMDTPPVPALNEAKALLRELGAIDQEGRITEDGSKLRELPLPPRLARMLLHAGEMGEALLAAEIALVLTEPALGGKDVDLGVRIDALRRDPRARDARAMAARWTRIAARIAEDERRRRRAVRGPRPGEGSAPGLSVGALLALAYPDRIAKRRGGGGSFLLANGRGARIDAASRLERESFLAVAEISGAAAHGRIALAAAITPAEIEALFADHIESREEVTFDETTGSLRGRRFRSLGAIVLVEQPMSVTANEESARLLAEGVARIGIERLPWTKPLRQWRDRVMFLRREKGEAWPDLSDAALSRNAADWLSDAFCSKTALAQLSADEFAQSLQALLPWSERRVLEAEAPTHFTAPSGSSVPIDYAAEQGPRVAIRVQELFGLDRHPALAGGKTPLVIELLSPAHRPVQVTRDLPGFWRGTYAAVKAEMKGRYPRHPWPDDPRAATPTTRAKKRS
jgi:ATP-dependent helicase HrpB